jgi:hypothetical protein
MFGTKVPSSVAFVVAILVFLLPFTEIRCGGTKLMHKSGLDFAMGNQWKTVAGALPGDSNDVTTKTMSAGKEQAGYTQYFIIGALALAVIGLLLALGNSKGASAGGILVGVLAAGSLIAFMLDLKKNFENSLREQAINKATEGADDAGLEGIGNTMNDIKPTLAFTPWFYIAVLAFLAAAIFCYMKMKSYRTDHRQVS